MKEHFKDVLWPVFVKTTFPALLGAAGALFAILWEDGFRAFCGVG